MSGGRVYSGGSRVVSTTAGGNCCAPTTQCGSVVRETFVRDPQVVQVQGEVRRRTKVVEVPVVHHRVEVPGSAKYCGLSFLIIV